MLIISRKLSESIIIGDNIEIIISEISSDKVKLAINAPKNIPVFRRELLEVKQQNQQANTAKSKLAVDMLKKLIDHENK